MEKVKPKLNEEYLKAIQMSKKDEKISINMNMTIKDYSPIIQISTETMLEQIKKGDIKNLIYTEDIRKELPIYLSEIGVGSLRPMTVMELFEIIVKEMENQEGLFYENDGKMLGYTWYQYMKKVKYFARALISIGVEPFRTVNILGFNSPQWFMAYLGGMYACVPPVGVYPTISSESAIYIAEHSECGCIVLDSLTNFKKYEKDLKKLKYLKAIIFYCELSDKELKSLTNPFVPIYIWKDFLSLGKRALVDFEFSTRISMQKPGNCCNLIYTSGTTGPPKAVMLSHDNLTWTARALEITYGDLIGYNQKLVSFLPLSHIAGQIVDIFLTMVTRSQVYFARSDALSGSLVETLRKVKPTVFFGVPRIFEKFEEKIKLAVESSSLIKRRIIKWAQKIGLKTVERRFKGEKQGILFNLANYLVFSRIRAALGFGNTKIVAFGAAPMKKSTIDFFKSLNIPLFNNYGMSETTGPQFLNLGEIGVDLYSAGLTLKGTDVKIEHPDRDGIGEIFFRGRNRFMGYFKDLEATMQTIDKNGYIHSGDSGYLNIKNNLVITGRIKELIVTAGGENIAPIPIEENLKDICKLISNLVIIGDNRPYLVALITLKSDNSGNISEKDDNGGLTSQSLHILRTIDQNIYSGSSFNVIDVINDEKVKKYIQAGIDKVNERAVSRAQIIRKWHLLPNDFTIESGELTHTHKVKRKYIDQKYSKYIQALYSNYKF